MAQTESERSRGGRRRPAWLRALGISEPPETVELDGEAWRRAAVLKHDSFAATALYERANERVICKFNRAQPVLGLPMQWAGRALAKREHAILTRLADLPGFPSPRGPIRAGGKELTYATGHRYIEGRPLGRDERVGDDFFPQLERVVRSLHERHAAHVDLNKRENIIVGDDGKPYLIDYQVHFALPSRGVHNNPATRALLRLFQRSDEYHLRKHWARLRPDQLSELERDVERLRPWWIRLWRLWTDPVRRFRRGLLVALGVRSGKGAAASEHEPEEAFRE